MTFLESVIESIIKKSTTFNPDDVQPPRMVMWPDKEGQWKPIVQDLRKGLFILTLDSDVYDPEVLCGPAIWIRCMLEKTLPDASIPGDQIPVIYIPGYSNQELSTLGRCPTDLKTLIAYRYLATTFTHPNGKDWTIAAFLQSTDSGIGAHVGSDLATKEAIRRSVNQLANVEVELLQRQPQLNAGFFNDLLNPDITLNLLSWLNDSNGFKETLEEDQMAAFVDSCTQRFGINVNEAGEMEAAKRLGFRETQAWEVAWQRFCENPDKYPDIITRLNALPSPSSSGTFQLKLGYKEDSWPQENARLENDLRAGLELSGTYLPQEARNKITELEKEHGKRRDWVWANLGKSPLAMCLEHLASLANQTAKTLGGNTIGEIRDNYVDYGWLADQSAILSLRVCEEPSEDSKLIEKVIDAVYKPWLEEAATSFQNAVINGYGENSYNAPPILQGSPGTCFLFTDGLRLDLAYMLKDKLDQAGSETKLETRLTAIPSITATAKPAVSPVSNLFQSGPGLDPSVIVSGARYNSNVLEKQLAESGYQVLKGDSLGDPQGLAWTETGDIDSLGHGHPTKLPFLIDEELNILQRRITALLSNGWQKIILVTDHGWIMLPTGLDKAELAQDLTEDKIRKGRCSRLKPGAITNGVHSMEWYWNPAVRIGIAPGIKCFEAGKQYEHGGISPQECVTPVLTITSGELTNLDDLSMELSWTNLRCLINISGHQSGYKVDFRTKAGDAGTSVLPNVRDVTEEGPLRILVEDDALEGLAIFCVVLDDVGRVMLQKQTTVGGES